MFNWANGVGNRRRGNCKKCEYEATKKYRKENRERVKEQRKWVLRRHKYGIERADWENFLLLQDGKCAICLQSFEELDSVVVDHDHSCCPSNRTCGNCVRGLLCRMCNSGIGMFSDDPQRLIKAFEYLGKERS